MKRWIGIVITTVGAIAIISAIITVGAIAFLALAQPSQALTCKTLNGQEICILSVKRSAKNHWEYRASVSVDGVTLPLEKYDCRDRRRTLADGTTQTFQHDGAGTFICSLLN
ncbi:MAG: hypothetical protein WBA57_07575 [Elainellaceae cyanobacterium]